MSLKLGECYLLFYTQDEKSRFKQGGSEISYIELENYLS